MKKVPQDKIKKILIVRPELIGDTILLTPLISAIKDRFPAAQVHLLLQPLAKEVVSGNPEVAGYIETERYGGRAEFFRLLKVLKKEKFDLGLVLEDNPSPEYAFLLFLAGIPYRLGDKSRLLYGWTYNLGTWLDSSLPDLHMIELHARLLAPLDINNISFPLRLFPKPAEKPVLKKEGRLIGVHIGTGGGNRALLAKTYAEISDALQESLSCNVVLLGGKRETDTLEQIRSFARRPFIDLVDKIPLSGLFQVIGQLDVFIGVDSGPLHAAAALQRPSVAIYTANDVKAVRWFPWMCRNILVKSQNDCRLKCSHRECKLDDCIRVIDPKEVVKAARALLEGKGNKNNEETRRQALIK
jgi:ADP-heptose:LPS heptosyltransferase